MLATVTDADNAELRVAVASRIESLAAAVSSADSMAVDPVTPIPSWRDRVRDVTQAIVEPDRLGWMDDDETLNDLAFSSRALSEIDSRFERCVLSVILLDCTLTRYRRPLYNPSPQSRVALANELRHLACALARHLHNSCPADPGKSAINAIPPCLRVSTLILDGPENEVTPPVRKAVYDALARSINHQSAAYGRGGLDRAAEFAARGLKDNDRSVRLSAG